jgi:hypothetical protein
MRTLAGFLSAIAVTLLASMAMPEIASAEPGDITIIKSAGDEDASFTLSITAPGNQPCEDTSFGLNDGSSATDSETFSGCTVGVDYTVTETNVPSGWELDDITCSENGDVDFEESGSSVIITLNEDDAEATCTFTNLREVGSGSIIITKDVDPEPDGTDFSFGDDIPGCTIGTLDDDLASGTPDSVTCTGVPPGDYVVTESSSTSYLLFDISCTDPDGQTSTSGSSAFIDLDAGETVHCVFKNHATAAPPTGTGTGSITITKETYPKTSDFEFVFDSPFGPFELEDDESRTFTGLASGIYVIEERGVNGWLLANVICNDSNSNRSGHSAFIELDPGQHVTCKFINESAKTAPIDRKTPTPKPTPAIISPPSTGDGGLAANGVPWVVGVLAVVAISSAAWVFFQKLVARSRPG